MKKLKLLISIAFLICNFTLTIAQSKVVILDSIQAKKIILQLEKGDLAIKENIVWSKLDTTSQMRISNLQLANDNLLKAFDEKQKETNQYKDAVKIQEKIIKKESNKKNFYKITTLVLLVSTILLI
jgi:hypothetical protein